MKLSQLLFICLLLSSISVNAQYWYYKENVNKQVDGYLVNALGDTLRGKIVIDTPLHLRDNVSFFSSKEPEKKQTFNAKQIKGFGFEKTLWESKAVIDLPVPVLEKESWIKDDYQFHVLMKKGTINLYQYYVVAGVDAEDEHYDVIDVLWYAQKLNEKPCYIKLQKLNKFKAELQSMISDNAEISYKVQKGELSLDDYEYLIDMYNKSKKR